MWEWTGGDIPHVYPLANMGYLRYPMLAHEPLLAWVDLWYTWWSGTSLPPMLAQYVLIGVRGILLIGVRGILLIGVRGIC